VLTLTSANHANPKCTGNALGLLSRLQLPRPLPLGTSVNKGKRKGRGFYAPTLAVSCYLKRKLTRMSRPLSLLSRNQEEGMRLAILIDTLTNDIAVIADGVSPM
jgi:hypothetical protein